MPFKIYKNAKPNSEITEIAVYYNGRGSSYCIMKYTDTNYKVHKLINLLNFLNDSNLVSVACADEIMRDSNGFIIKQDGYYVFDKPELLDNKCIDTDVIPEEYQCILDLKNITHPAWYKFSNYFSLIAQTAINIIENYEGTKIFSLGQSPAWLVRAAQLIPTECEFEYIPFSGNFYAPVSPTDPEDFNYDDYDKKALHYGKRNHIKPINIQNYYTMLDSLQLNPSDIIAQHLKGKKTVILEFTHTGSGLASFLSLLLDRTNELRLDINELKNAIKIVILVDSKKEICLEEIILGKTSFKCSHLIAKNLPYTNLINDLANSSDEDRLVPSYRSEEWQAPPKLLSNEKFIEPLIKGLKAEVTTTYRQYISDIIVGLDTSLEQVSSLIGSYIAEEILEASSS